MAGRYREEWVTSWNDAHSSMQRIGILNAQLDIAGDRARLSTVLDAAKDLEQSEAVVQKMAIGQGGDASGQAFDKLRTDVADREAKLDGQLQQVVDSQSRMSQTEMEALTAANHSEAVVLWIATILGALVGGIFSNLLATRIVASIKQVADRAESICPG